MKLQLKRELIKTLNLMGDMQKMIEGRWQTEEKRALFEWLVQLQEAGVEVGQTIEKQGNAYIPLVQEVEEYCEIIYRLGESAVGGKGESHLWDDCSKKLSKIRQDVERIEAEVKIAFLPYKYSMWDCMESIWQAAREDKRCSCQVIPIPYYDRREDGSLGEMHYEGECFPAETEVIDYQEYNLATERPDIVYIHNPYDEYNKVTCILPVFFMENIKKCGAVLIYVPYYIAGYCKELDNMLSSCRTKGAVCSDYIILQSHKLKAAYEYCGIEAEKLLVTGSPKIDKMCALRQKDGKGKWQQNVTGKKVVLLNSGLDALLRRKDWLSYIDDIVEQVLQEKDLVLIWRPHPLLFQTIQSLKNGYLEEYQKICERIETAENGILDLSEDYTAAITSSDAMISDYSSLVLQYTFTGKPVLLLEGSAKNREKTVFCDYFSNYFVYDGIRVSEYIEKIKNGIDDKKEERIFFAEKSVVNGDGTCGIKTHMAIMEKVYC